MVNLFLQRFNQFKIVLCMCPKCDSLMRLSDLHLRSTGKSPKTWLDEFELHQQKIEKKEEKFAEKEHDIRKKAIERGRTQVLNLIQQSMYQQLSKLRYDPYDIKPILHPIDFAVFNGMNKNKMEDVVLLSRKTKNPILKNHQIAVAKAVKSRSYDWKVVRVSRDGQIEFE